MPQSARSIATARQVQNALTHTCRGTAAVDALSQRRLLRLLGYSRISLSVDRSTSCSLMRPLVTWAADATLLQASGFAEDGAIVVLESGTPSRTDGNTALAARAQVRTGDRSGGRSGDRCIRRFTSTVVRHDCLFVTGWFRPLRSPVAVASRSALLRQRPWPQWLTAEQRPQWNGSGPVQDAGGSLPRRDNNLPLSLAICGRVPSNPHRIWIIPRFDRRVPRVSVAVLLLLKSPRNAQRRRPQQTRNPQSTHLRAHWRNGFAPWPPGLHDFFGRTHRRRAALSEPGDEPCRRPRVLDGR